ncbi:hypothetical protein I6F15_07845 [Bradyrhizobium sp. BRP14]|nr:hypothetical protein [Bradyrhizobium sp. BRP14]
MSKTHRKSKGAPDATTGRSEPVKSDSDLRSKTQPLEPDELPKHQAVREAARSKRDDFLVESDLEDADQRFPLPSMKDQD